ncbi:MAG: OmpH family outer membrane protein [Puniceicoccales bacterium]|nr:OmpH family outer membrane protein [Puniceicoccales bacterium]
MNSNSLPLIGAFLLGFGAIFTSLIAMAEGPSAGTSLQNTSQCCAILTFNANRVMQGYAIAKSRDEELKTLADSLQKDGQKKMEELVNAQEEIRKLAEKMDNSALTDEARDKMKTEAEKQIEALHEKEMNFRQWQEKSESQLSEVRAEMLSKTIGELKVIASELAEEEGALLVLNGTNPDILYTAPATDRSEKIIARLNQRYPAPVKALPKTK